MSNTVDASQQVFLNQLNRIQDRMERAQRQMSTGLRIEKPSDDPDHISSLLQLRSELDRNSQIRLNFSRINAEVNTAESILQRAVITFDKVRTLGQQGASSTNSAETRTSIAGELESILKNFIGMANSEVSGRYLFSGDSDQTAAYSYDSANVPPYSLYGGTVATRELEHPSGIRFEAARTGQEIFDSADPDRNVFAAIDNLRVALLNNDDAAIQAALAPLPKVSQHLNMQLAFYGSVQNQVADGIDFAEKNEIRLKANIQDIEGADAAEALIELSQAEYQQQAALKVRAQIPQTSLFDYMR
jgi:flagellar hook-associated protein 3 FlgL